MKIATVEDVIKGANAVTYSLFSAFVYVTVCQLELQDIVDWIFKCQTDIYMYNMKCMYAY